jgi:hypothetical protein
LAVASGIPMNIEDTWYFNPLSFFYSFILWLTMIPGEVI